MSYKLLQLLLISFVTFSSFANNKGDIDILVVTEDSFPIQYIEKKEITGPATALVKRILNTANITFRIRVLPWARAYKMATHHANVLIYSIAFTDNRAEHFKWVGEIKTLEYYLFGNKNLNISQQSTLTDLKQLRIGTVRDSATEQYLKLQGFNNLTSVVKGNQNFLLFEQNRIDLFPANKLSFDAICLKYQFDCSNSKPLFKLDLPPIKLQIAFSKQTDDKIVNIVKEAYTTTMEDKDFLQKIGIK